MNGNRRSDAEQALAADRARQTVFQSYIDEMTKLILDRGLDASSSAAIRPIARSQTLSALRQLDGERKGLTLRFLYDSNLLKRVGIIDLGDADLSHATLAGIVLSGADPSDADLSRVDLNDADLRVADLSFAKLSDVRISFADLRYADLSNADLRRADLRSAELSRANLSSASLSDANLDGATVGNEQLAQASSLVGAVMPDGTQMTEARWEEFKQRYGGRERPPGAGVPGGARGRNPGWFGRGTNTLGGVLPHLVRIAPG